MSDQRNTRLPTRETGDAQLTAGRQQPPAVLVLLEGRSDVAALQALAAGRGLTIPSDRVELVDMGGATNIRRHVRARLHPAYPSTLLGLCDARETPFFLRALRAEGLAARRPEDMAMHGFHVCHDDLEDELIRALGTVETVGLLHTLGLGEQFATFCRQPAWRGRPVHQQLHRFVGTTSGRKEALAGAFAGALSPGRVPDPLRRLLDQVETHLSPIG